MPKGVYIFQRGKMAASDSSYFLMICREFQWVIYGTISSPFSPRPNSA